MCSTRFACDAEDGLRAACVALGIAGCVLVLVFCRREDIAFWVSTGVMFWVAIVLGIGLSMCLVARYDNYAYRRRRRLGQEEHAPPVAAPPVDTESDSDEDEDEPPPPAPAPADAEFVDHV